MAKKRIYRYKPFSGYTEYVWKEGTKYYLVSKDGTGWDTGFSTLNKLMKFHGIKRKDLHRLKR